MLRKIVKTLFLHGSKDTKNLAYILPLDYFEYEELFRSRPHPTNFNRFLWAFYNVEQVYSIINTIRTSMMRLNFIFENYPQVVELAIKKQFLDIVTYFFVTSNVFFEDDLIVIDPSKIVYKKEKFYYNGKEISLRVIWGDSVPPLHAAWDVVLLGYFITKREKEIVANSGAVGILSPKDSNYPLTEKDLEFMQSQLNQRRKLHGGGSIMFSNTSLVYQQIGLKPEEMTLDYFKTSVYRQICNVYSIDSSILNDPENKTYSNKSEALRALYVNAIIPYAMVLTSKLTDMLISNGYINEDAKIIVDSSPIEYLQKDREKLFNMILQSYKEGIIERQEARELLSEILGLQT